ncbi:MAG: DNA-3-methyladenine glycosylase family protein [Hyphomicrobiaceae bacterium]
MNRITTLDDIRRGADALRATCPAFQRMHDEAGLPPLRVGSEGFVGLARIIVGQQLSIASAGAIWSRMSKKFDPMTSQRVARARDTTLKSVGLSAAKIRALRAAAASIEAGTLDLTPGAYATDDDLVAALTAVKGIGPWTADIYLMFSVARPDAFAPGDLALQVAAQWAFEWQERPDPATLASGVEHWRPWRGVGARMLWHYYAHVRARRIADPV